MGRHQLVKQRRKPPLLLAAVMTSLAVLATAGASPHPVAVEVAAESAAPATASPCCLEVVPASQVDAHSALPVSMALFSSAAPARSAAAPVAASRWRVIDSHRILPKGVAPEAGLQVKTIFLARSLSVVFPEIHSIGGMRADALRWHPDGLALDVMVPNPSSPGGIALGNRIVAYALQNAARFGLQDAIWRGVYYTPSGPQNSGAAHFDHVHLTTFGGGYPTGDEIYYR
ncbi:hypothetical protein ASD37_08540 [Mycobacterium sp. Root135]|uniref:hypothetical protein n=1 Tax=Mycobacterium sp. Root135 TaxID=1736457 RepID=UPI0006F2A19A|nr:hypothetical protein [Mycobacterium sp. Root135]KQY08003.1 hypothetical protein ASD37_08540 [Mycobacterium sp. Root135]